jgi:Gamma-glutamyltransferase
MGFNSADYIHTVIEAEKLALADRDEYYGDPNL